MGPPLLIGAGLGAATSLAMGKNPFMGALLGGATGGAFGGAGGFGSGFTQGGGLFSGLQGVAPEAVSLGSGGYSALGSNAFGGIGGVSSGIQLKPLMTQAVNTADDIIANPNLIDNMVSRGFNGTTLPTGSQGIQLSQAPMGGAGVTGLNNMGVDSLSLLDSSRLAYNTPLSFGEKLSNLGSGGYSYLKNNPTTTLGGVNSLSNLSNQQDQAKQQRLNEAVATGAQPIQRKQFDPSSVIAAAPSYGLSRDEVARGKVAQIASQARLNDEDERKIVQFYQSLIG